MSGSGYGGSTTPRPIGGEGKAPFISTTNSTSTPLATSATYTGTWEEVWQYGSISVIASADVAGTLWADFSTDGATQSRNIQLSAGTDGSLGIHSLIPVAKYFRVRVVNGSSGQSSMDVQTLYHGQPRIAQPTSRIGQSLTRYSDVLNARAVITGEAEDGSFVNARVSPVGALDVEVSDPVTAFGEVSVAQLTPEIQLKFNHGILPDVMISNLSGSGTLTSATSMLVASSGATTGSRAEMVSRFVNPYRPGQGSEVRFTALFGTPSSDGTQLVGLGTAEDGLFVGYNGASLSILRREGGQVLIKTLTVSNGANVAGGTITLTVDGTAIPVTLQLNDSRAEVAAKIAAADYSSAGGWQVDAAGSKVLFRAIDTETRGGAYSFVDTATTGATGNWVTSASAVAASDNWVAQADWNQDPFDGSGVLPTIDTSKGNVFRIKYQWLGFGAARWYAEDPRSGRFNLIHTEKYANANTQPSLRTPDMPLHASAHNGAGTANVIVKSASMGAFAEGISNPTGLVFSYSAERNIDTTEKVVFAIHNKVIFNGSTNHSTVYIKSITLGNNSSNKVAEFRVYQDVSLEGSDTTTAVSWSDIDSTQSSVEAADGDAGLNAVTSGRRIRTYQVGAADGRTISLDDPIRLSPCQTLVIAALMRSGGAAADLDAGVTWVEEL